MKIIKIMATLAGLAMLGYLIAQNDIRAVIAACQTLGWGILLVLCAHWPPLWLNTLSWQLLLEPLPPTLSTKKLLLFRWIGQSVNTLLPVAQVGGDVLRVRLLKPYQPQLAAASVLADFTLGILAQLLFTLLAVALLLWQYQLDQFALLGVLLLLAVPVLLFFYLQQRGLFGHSVHWPTKLLPLPWAKAIKQRAQQFDAAMRTVYQHRRHILLALWLKFLAWLLGTIETVTVLYCLTGQWRLLDALILESFGYAARSFGFLIPAAVGIQEGAFVFIGGLLGFDAVSMLTLSLAKRLRELLMGGMGLLAWSTLK